MAGRRVAVAKRDYDVIEEVEAGAEYAVSRAIEDVGVYFDSDREAYRGAVRVFKEVVEWLAEDYGEYTLYGCTVIGDMVSCEAEFQEFAISVAFVMSYHPSTFDFVVGADSEELENLVEEALAEMVGSNAWKYVAEKDIRYEGADQLLQAIVIFIENAVGAISDPEGQVEIDQDAMEYTGVLTFTVSGSDVSVYFGGELVVLLQEDIVEVIPSNGGGLE